MIILGIPRYLIILHLCDFAGRVELDDNKNVVNNEVDTSNEPLNHRSLITPRSTRFKEPSNASHNYDLGVPATSNQLFILCSLFASIITRSASTKVPFPYNSGAKCSSATRGPASHSALCTLNPLMYMARGYGNAVRHMIMKVSQSDKYISIPSVTSFYFIS